MNISRFRSLSRFTFLVAMMSFATQRVGIAGFVVSSPKLVENLTIPVNFHPSPSKDSVADLADEWLWRSVDPILSFELFLINDASGTLAQRVSTMTGPARTGTLSLVTPSPSSNVVLDASTDHGLSSVASGEAPFSWVMNYLGRERPVGSEQSQNGLPPVWEYRVGSVARDDSNDLPAPSSGVLLGIGLIVLGGFFTNLRKFLRFVRSVGRRSRRGTTYRYFY